MSTNEDQAEEIEVLDSIFVDDDAYRKVTDSCFQYKVGEDGSIKSFLIEFNWPEDYPNCALEINLNAFYNKKLLPEVKAHILSLLQEQADNMIGCAMTFTLIDFAKENQTDLLSNQPEKLVKVPEPTESSSKNKEKKEQLTKAQKRKLYDRFGASNDRPRGWNWVDVVRHLSQTGKLEEQGDS